MDERINEVIEITNMCMIEKNDLVLVQNRVKSWPGIAFPGGHVELGESIVDSVIREIKEETGLSIHNPKLCGIKQWFRDDKRSICFMFKTNEFSGEVTSNDEGENFFVKKSDIKNMKLSVNFEYMLEVFLNDNLTEHVHKNINGEITDILK